MARADVTSVGRRITVGVRVMCRIHLLEACLLAITRTLIVLEVARVRTKRGLEIWVNITLADIYERHVYGRLVCQR